MTSTSPHREAFDPLRRLCPDGTCIGIIGPDGHCKVCGAIDPDGPRPADSAATPPVASDEEQTREREPAGLGAFESNETFDPKRKLCPDGTCVGVIGPDGRCNLCGCAAEG